MGGFERRGRFKKAGNLNHACSFSLFLSALLDDLRPTAHAMKKKLAGIDEGWFDEDEELLYEEALLKALEAFPETTAAGNVRIGELVLMIDSDTRVPADCFLDAASEVGPSHRYSF